ncbi:hypothetical protein Barb6_02386 [Bacteroidales bacterium Barb6]|nr:hypothetical protein Barb6_02386 [Bacteroidales bacterium Barb6]
MATYFFQYIRKTDRFQVFTFAKCRDSYGCITLYSKVFYFVWEIIGKCIGYNMVYR